MNVPAGSQPSLHGTRRFFHSLLVDKKEERGEILHAAACPAGLVEAPSGGNPREVKCPCPWMEGGGEGGGPAALL